jgi:hypothetical protein
MIKLVFIYRTHWRKKCQLFITCIEKTMSNIHGLCAIIIVSFISPAIANLLMRKVHHHQPIRRTMPILHRPPIHLGVPTIYLDSGEWRTKYRLQVDNDLTSAQQSRTLPPQIYTRPIRAITSSQMMFCCIGGFVSRLHYDWANP